MLWKFGEMEPLSIEFMHASDLADAVFCTIDDFEGAPELFNWSRF